MGFWIVIALLCSGYSLYKIYELESSMKSKGSKTEKKLDTHIHERLKSLTGKTCEVKVTKPMLFIDAMHSIKGTIVDIDEQWVVILGKKDTQYVIRLTMVKDVAQIL